MKHKETECYLLKFKDLVANPDRRCHVHFNEWINGEGFVITFDDNKSFSISHSEWRALKKVVKAYYEKDN